MALKRWYRAQTGKDIDLSHPRTYNEKVQWMKLHPKPLWSKLADKYAVRKYVEERIGAQYLVPLVGNNGGVWKKPEEIDFDSLPDKFVLKCNHGCGYNIIVKDKSELDIPAVRERLAGWLQEDFSCKYGFEMHYHAIPRRIIAEEYMENGGGDLYDYKVWCFNGKAHYVMFLSERNTSGLRMSFYDRDWEMQDISYTFPRHTEPCPKPACLEKLLELAEKLAQGLPHARVDFYVLNNGEIRFGEITLTSCSGVCKWEPESADAYFGSLFDRERDIPDAVFMEKAPQLPFIVSLTTYPARIATVDVTVRSLLNQTVLPEKILLWLSKEQFPGREEELPARLLQLTEGGKLEIRWCEGDIRSYKKLIPALEAYPDAVIVTADDDIVYKGNCLETLWRSYQQNPHAVHCHRITRMVWWKGGPRVVPRQLYEDKHGRYKQEFHTPSVFNKLTGCGCVLYPPHSLHPDVLREDLFMELAPTSDDIWFWLQGLRNGYKVMVVPGNNQRLEYVGDTQNTALSLVNDSDSMRVFYAHLNAIMDYYPELEKLFRTEPGRRFLLFRTFFLHLKSKLKDVVKKMLGR